MTLRATYITISKIKNQIKITLEESLQKLFLFIDPYPLVMKNNPVTTGMKYIRRDRIEKPSSVPTRVR